MSWIEAPESSSISRFRYLNDTAVLEIEFQKSGIYQYFDVSETVFEQFCAASSKGVFFAQNIRGVFRYARA